MLGIIIDGYGELRSQRKNALKERTGKCFICGLSREDFEARTLDW